MTGDTVGPNDVVGGIAPSVTLGVTSRAKAMAAEGADVYSFAAGETDFDTPAHIKAAAAQALADGKTKYAPVPGTPELRKAIVEKLGRDNGLTYGVEQIVVSDGAKHSLFNLFMALCRPGDEVLIPAPYWLSYPEMVRIAGGVPRIVEAPEADGFKVSIAALEAALSDRTRAIVVNSPSNPIGIVYSREELTAIAEFAVKHDLVIVSDEIYEKIVYDGTEHVSIASLGDDVFARTVTVNGFSKAYSMTGWRLGYLAGPVPLVKAVTALQSHSTSGAVTFAQAGALAALQGGDACIDEMLVAFNERRAYLFDRLDAMPGVTCVKPMGAFYMLPSIASTGMDSVTFCETLLERSGVALVPGKAFGVDSNVRVSYACSMETLREGMDRLEAFLGTL